MTHIGNVIDHAVDFLMRSGYQPTLIKLVSAERTNNGFIVKFDVGFPTENVKVLTYNESGELTSMTEEE